MVLANNVSSPRGATAQTDPIPMYTILINSTSKIVHHSSVPPSTQSSFMPKQSNGRVPKRRSIRRLTRITCIPPPHSSSPLALFFRHSRRTGNDDNIWLNVYFRLLLWADTDGLCFFGGKGRWLEEEEVVWFNQWLDLNLSPHGKSNWHQKQMCKRHVFLFTARKIGSLFVIGIYSAECDEDATENWLREGVEMTNTIIETKQIIIINEDDADEYPVRLAHQSSI